jgi:hypothetical protein
MRNWIGLTALHGQGPSLQCQCRGFLARQPLGKRNANRRQHEGEVDHRQHGDDLDVFQVHGLHARNGDDGEGQLQLQVVGIHVVHPVGLLHVLGA